MKHLLQKKIAPGGIISLFWVATILVFIFGKFTNPNNNPFGVMIYLFFTVSFILTIFWFIIYLFKKRS